MAATTTEYDLNLQNLKDAVNFYCVGGVSQAERSRRFKHLVNCCKSVNEADALALFTACSTFCKAKGLRFGGNSPRLESFKQALMAEGVH